MGALHEMADLASECFSETASSPLGAHQVDQVAHQVDQVARPPVTPRIPRTATARSGRSGRSRSHPPNKMGRESPEFHKQRSRSVPVPPKSFKEGDSVLILNNQHLHKNKLECAGSVGTVAKMPMKNAQTAEVQLMDEATPFV